MFGSRKCIFNSSISNGGQHQSTRVTESREYVLLNSDCIIWGSFGTVNSHWPCQFVVPFLWYNAVVMGSFEMARVEMEEMEDSA